MEHSQSNWQSRRYNFLGVKIRSFFEYWQLLMPESGRFAEAVDTAPRGLELATKAG